MYNTNVEGKYIMECAITKIKGVGRRFANVCLKKAHIDIHKRAGELTAAEEERLTKVLDDPLSAGVPEWMLNRIKDFDNGKSKQILVNSIPSTLRSDLERLRKIRCNRGIRHQCGHKVRGQHTKSTGRFGAVVGVERRK